MRSIFVLCLSAQVILLYGQNLVPNPSFEEVKKIATFWMFNDLAFNNHIEHWTSPNGGSPDLLVDEVLLKYHTTRKGLSMEGFHPRSGKNMVGIKTFGCLSDMPHCKEYLQVKLKEPIRNGQIYLMEYWLRPLENGIKTNSIGLFFTDRALSGGDGEEAVMYNPVVNVDEILKDHSQWTKISAYVQANSFLDYMLIGNFNMDPQTDTIAQAWTVDYSYYLVDDVMVRPVTMSEFVSADVNWDWGSTLLLNTDINKGLLDLNNSLKLDLDKLAAHLKSNTNYVIEVAGHCHQLGNSDRNRLAAEEMVKLVRDYMILKGVDRNQISYNAIGDEVAAIPGCTDPIKNSRVEIVVIQK